MKQQLYSSAFVSLGNACVCHPSKGLSLSAQLCPLGKRALTSLFLRVSASLAPSQGSCCFYISGQVTPVFRQPQLRRCLSVSAQIILILLLLYFILYSIYLSYIYILLIYILFVYIVFYYILFYFHLLPNFYYPIYIQILAGHHQ